MSPEDLYIDEEFKSLLPSSEPLDRLTANIVANGFEDPIIYWSNPADGKPCIIDGHRRHWVFMNCPDLDGAAPKLRGKRFASREDVKRWMLDYQLSRRNLTLAERDAALAKLYELEKEQSKPAGKTSKTPEKQGSYSGATSAPESDGKARDRVASATGVSPRTVNAAVKRDAERTDALANIRIADYTFAEQLDSGECKLSDADLRKLGKLPKAEIKSAVKKMRLGENWKPKRQSATTAATRSAKPATRHAIFKAFMSSVGATGRELTKLETAIGDQSTAIRTKLDEVLQLATAWRDDK